MKAIFIDRDGTICKERFGTYISKVSQFEFLPGVKDAFSKLRGIDYKIFVVSNQQGVGKGALTEEQLNAVTSFMCTELDSSGELITEVAHCRHLENENCGCRKPAPGLILNLAKKYKIDLANSWMIGDCLMDVEAGKSTGVKTIITVSGREKTESEWQELSQLHPTFIADNLLDAINHVLYKEERLLDAINKERLMYDCSNYFEQLKNCLGKRQFREIIKAVDILFDCWCKGSNVFVCGNGGSATLSNHFVNDLVKATRYTKLLPYLRAYSLAANVGLISAIGNDNAYSEVFSEQFTALRSSGDVLVVISVSGASPNIQKVVSCANEKGDRVIALTSSKGNNLEKSLACIKVDSSDYGIVESAHSFLCHLITKLLIQLATEKRKELR